VDVSERKLLLVVWKGVHYALDNFCYHSGMAHGRTHSEH